MTKKSEPKTKKTAANVPKFIAAIPDDERRKDLKTIVALIQKVTGEKPALWGTSLIGFGTYHYKGASGREGEWPLTAVAARKQNLTVYIMAGFSEYKGLLRKLGPHSKKGSCLHIRHVSDIHLPTLSLIVKKSVQYMKKKYPKK